MTSPCKDCPDRHAHCHSACNRYGEYAAMFEKVRRDVRKYGLYKTGKS